MSGASSAIAIVDLEECRPLAAMCLSSSTVLIVRVAATAAAGNPSNNGAVAAARRGDAKELIRVQSN